MDKKFSCYCGLYCVNCAVKVKVEPASKILYDEMKTAGFEEIIKFIPDGDKFWAFLKSMAVDGVCVSCRDGSGNPGCEVRECAREKGVEMCAFCESYPCARIDSFDAGYPVLKQDNALLREKGWDVWGKMQDERQTGGFTYSHKSDE